MIDLHTHTNESDGAYTPSELVAAAAACGVRTLAITDHDTFEGYLKARPAARQAGIELLCGIEVSTRLDGQWYHVLGYFLETPPTLRFSKWLAAVHERRRDRNQRLAARLTELGVPVSVTDAERLGRSITGRVHFARILVDRGYVGSIEEAFQRYVGSQGAAFVRFSEPDTLAALGELKAARAVAVLAHPVRYRSGDETALLRRLREAGLDGVEIVHTDHRDADTAHYQQLAANLGLAVTGGSDFHGEVTPHARLGYGNHGQTLIPAEFLDSLRHAFSRS